MAPGIEKFVQGELGAIVWHEIDEEVSTRPVKAGEFGD